MILSKDTVSAFTSDAALIVLSIGSPKGRPGWHKSPINTVQEATQIMWLFGELEALRLGLRNLRL